MQLSVKGHFLGMFASDGGTRNNAQKWGSTRFAAFLLDTIETTGGKLKRINAKCPLNFIIKFRSSIKNGWYSKKMDMKKKTELGNTDLAVIFLAHKSLNNE